MKKPLTVASAVVGIASLGVSILALFIPILSPLPFLILSVLCFIHVLPRFISKYKRLPVRTRYLNDFIRERSMTRRNKIKTLIVTTAIMLALILLFDSIWATIIIAVLCIVKLYYFIFCVWTIVETGHGIVEKREDGNNNGA